jgi:hypothetical protein
LIKSLEAPFAAVKVPVLTFQTKTLNLDIRAQAVTNVQLKEHEINLPGPGGKFTVYGPPLKLDKSTVGIDLENTPLVSGLEVNYILPLQPVGDVFHNVGVIIGTAGEQINGTGDSVNELQNQTLEAKANLENTVKNMNDFAMQLHEASQNILVMGKGHLFSLIPALILGYSGLLHLGFALTGLALLIM